MSRLLSVLRLTSPMIVAMAMSAPTATNIPMKVLEELPVLSEKEEEDMVVKCRHSERLTRDAENTAGHLVDI